MRLAYDTDLNEVFEGLTKAQQRRVEAVEKARAAEADAIKAIQNRAREGIRKALDAGVPARILADRVGVPPARIYQMRDEALTYLALAGEK